MGENRSLDGWSDPPSDVRITVLQDQGDRSWRGRHLRLLRRRYFATAVVAMAAAVGSLVATASVNSPGRRNRPGAGDLGPAGVAAAYGYPPRCLRVTTASSDHAFARADFNHANPCGRYTGDPTAIFHVVDGSWRPVLEAVWYPCPAPGIPAVVQKELEICPFLARPAIR